MSIIIIKNYIYIIKLNYIYFQKKLEKFYVRGVWTGWWDEPEEGEWTSVTTSNLLSQQKFKPWFPGEPNGLTVESCGSLHITGNKGIWLDSICDNKYCVACQISSAPVFVLRGM